MWIFIDVPASEAKLAQNAGAELHRKSGKWFFDDAKYPASDFARWKRITAPDAQPQHQATKQSPGDSRLSLHEVASLTGHTNKIIRALIEDGRFPRPVDTAGISSRSDRWSLSQVQDWIDFNGFGALARGRLDEQRLLARDEEAGKAAFYTMMEVAKEAGVAPLQRAFQILRASNVLLESEDAALNNRPTDEYMKKGWFGRVERYLPSKGQMIYQTVVTSAGRKPIVTLLKQQTGGV